VGRAVDRATGGTPGAPDGTPGNPPGTAVGRALDRAVGTPGAPDGTPGNPPGTAAGRALDRATEPNRDAAGSAVPGAVRAPTAGTTGTMATGAAATAGAMHAMGDNQRVSQIIGSRVYNDRNEAIGEVDDVILSGTAHTAVISVGGFLGLGARLVQVPLADIRWNAERERMMLPGATKEQLQSRPAFDYATLRRG
jgi:sporulation protein YlmC with PRC-barrel domain